MSVFGSSPNRLFFLVDIVVEESYDFRVESFESRIGIPLFLIRSQQSDQLRHPAEIALHLLFDFVDDILGRIVMVFQIADYSGTHQRFADDVLLISVGLLPHGPFGSGYQLRTAILEG